MQKQLIMGAVAASILIGGLIFLSSSGANPSQTLPQPTSSPTQISTQTQNVTPTQLTTPTAQIKQQIKALYPSQILNLTNWKITLPIGKSEHPTEVEQPELKNYVLDPWFVVAPAGDSVIFRASVNGTTTSGSSYPRSELREMSDNGEKKANWSSTSGVHSMFEDLAITHVPITKKHIVAGQIHDAQDDVIVIRLDYPNLYINVDGENVHTLDQNYTLGKRFTVKFVVSGGETKVYYDNQQNPSYTLSKKYTGAYFKIGAYTQSNCSREGLFNCNSNNYGEVVVYQVTVTHE